MLELNEIVPIKPEGQRIIGCLSVYNAAQELPRVLDSWRGQFDSLVVVDGSWGPDTHPSDDQTVNILNRWCNDNEVYINVRFGHWASQLEKRTRYFAARAQDDICFILDADEEIEGNVRDQLYGDIGWVTIRSPLYRREYKQPRLIRWRPGLRYAGRHHWIYDDAQLLTTHQYGGVGVVHQTVPLTLINHSAGNAGFTNARQVQFAEESAKSTGTGGLSDAQVSRREALRIAQLCTYDPGGVAFRLHNAINRTTPHESHLISDSRRNTFSYPSEYSFADNESITAFKRHIDEAHILHCHMEYGHLIGIGAQINAPIVIHHHGTVYRKHPAFWNSLDARLAQVRLVSNLELLRYGEGLAYLPNPVPVARYRDLAISIQDPRGDVLRIAHAPSKPELKGTNDLLKACEGLKGVKVVMIQGMMFSDALRLKASCHVTFDSFWLGMQCSGLEAAAMCMPVIAGDESIRQAYEHLVGYCPYTFANDVDQLREVIIKLRDDYTFYEQEADRVYQYVRNMHDEASVALRYLNILDVKLGWRRAASA